MKLLTVCFPVFNESKHIDNLIKTIVGITPIDKEIIFIDGGSTDDTLDKIKSWQKKHSNIRLIHNQFRFVSHGFNLAYKKSKSKYITLMGAHCEYPDNYFELGLSLLEKGIADVIGGPLNQVGRTEKGSIISDCMSSKFGVGDTEFRTSKKREYVQSVAMAIYKRSVFEDIGLLDEELVRNQDDELHYRLNANGYKIFMEPAMEITYYVREDFKSLWLQYFNYGLYKPLVFKKVRSGLRIRHLIPPVFVCYLLVLPFILFISWVSIIPLVIYLNLVFIFSYNISKKPKHIIWAMNAFFVLHISYGSGMLFGLKKLK